MLLVWLVDTALPHVGDVVAGIDLDAEDPSQQTIEASYGLLLGQGESFSWVCHEAITEPGALLSPRYHQTAQQTWLAWLADAEQGRGGATLFRSADACDWTPPAGTEGQVIEHVSSSGQEVLAVAGAGGLLRSTDDGASFSPALSVPDRLFYTVLPGEGEIRWWASATDAAGERLFLWRQVGEDWLEQELARPEDVAVPMDLKLVATEADSAWVLLDPIGADALVRVQGEQIERLDTGTPGALTDVEIQGEIVWFIRDGLLLFSLQDGALTQHPAFPPGIGLDLVDGELWTAPQSQLTRSLLSHSADGGASFETVAYPDAILAPLTCPAGSHVATTCEPLWELLLPRIRGYDDPPLDSGLEDTGDIVIPPHPDDEDPDPVEPEPEKGCGCQHPVLPVWTGALMILAVTIRRRAR